MTEDNQFSISRQWQSTYENDAEARRIVEVDVNGNIITGSGRTQEYEDISFVTGDSPITLDVNNDIGRNAVDGYIICDGPGDFTVAFSDDGTNFGGEHTMKHREKINLKNLNIDKIRITWISDSSYRVAVV